MKDDGIESSRRRFLRTSAYVLGGVGAAFAAVPFLGSWQPSAQAQAAGAPVEVDVSKLEPGGQITVAWRGKPIWIVRRTEESLQELPRLDSLLRDPFSENPQQPTYAQNKYRSIKPEYLVLVGLCTHLGCVPSYKPELKSVGPDWQGGFYCPCHGSKFDMAGRVYRGVPAPLNLKVPPYAFVSDNRVIIGKSDVGEA